MGAPMSADAKTALAMPGSLWPSFSAPSHVRAIERVLLSDRGLPASTYELVTRAAELSPDLPNAESFHTPLVRTCSPSTRGRGS